MSNFGIYDLTVQQSVVQSLIEDGQLEQEKLPIEFNLITTSPYINFLNSNTVSCSSSPGPSGTSGPTGFVDFVTSAQSCSYNNCFINFTIYLYSHFMNAGLTNDRSANNITYGIWVSGPTEYNIIYNNNTVTSPFTFSNSDVFTISTTNNEVFYYQNGVLIYSSTLVDGTDPLYTMIGFSSTRPTSVVDNISFGYTESLPNISPEPVLYSANYSQSATGNPGVTINTTGGGGFPYNIISISITTNGGPILISANSDANITGPVGSQFGRVQLFRDSTPISNITQFESSANNINVPYNLTFIDSPPIGIYQYSLKLVGSSANLIVQFGEVNAPTLLAVEIPSLLIHNSSNLV